ncbi:GNAT family N-acetyltransferase [uncultured Thermanaerothrix sp.]|uniref:GNAT family N-acetyltransferase n=1 Tax=uncultured Thermanaerothrix sp. TaxID=1195149 RepID=UPI002618959A|nr:GNAT family N-acetyltransferase [uncultured Thermanaerothrix sp.]
MEKVVTQEKVPIRPLHLPQDILAVADLIEVCFANTMDPDGWEYLRRMRTWGLQYHNGFSASPASPPPMNGFVWEEEGRIVGNLNIVMPRVKSQHPLIVNVAVHPDYRRRGIAKRLTEKAIHYLKSWDYPSVWLQVREDNLAALRLYEGLGFRERARRTTWTATPSNKTHPRPLSAHIRPRQPAEWPLQAAWLERIYPEQVVWNLPLDLQRFRPGFLNCLRNLVSETPRLHFTALERGEPLGFCTWEATLYYADWLWVAPCPSWTSQALQTLLPTMRQRFGKQRPLSVNYPAGEDNEAFLTCGFSPQQTLIWMELPL